MSPRSLSYQQTQLLSINPCLPCAGRPMWCMQVVSSRVGGSVGTVGAERLVKTASSISSSPAAGAGGAVGIYLGPDTR